MLRFNDTKGGQWEVTYMQRGYLWYHDKRHGPDSNGERSEPGISFMFAD